MKFICTGDLHAGQGGDLGREPGERLAEQQAVWSQILDHAQQLEAWVLFAGDAFEGPIPTPEHYAAFEGPILRGGRACPILAITGNGRHDAAMRSTNALQAFQIPGLEVRSRPWVESFGGAAVCSLPWAPVGRVVATDGGGDRDEINQRVAAGVVEIARGLFAQAQADHPTLPKILLAHWSVGGATTPNGAPVDLFREPVLDAAALEAIGFDAIVLGHIHRHQVLSTGDAPMFYVGSPMPLNFGEADVDHGCYLLDVEAGKAAAYFLPIESRRLVTLNVDGPKTVGLDEVDGAIVKVKIRASEEEARRLDLAGYRQQLLDAGAWKVWAMQVEVEKPDVVRGATLDEDVTDVDALTRWIEINWDGLGLDTDSAGDLLELGAGYLERAGATA